MAKDKQKVANTKQKKIAKQKAKAKLRNLHLSRQGVSFDVRFGFSRRTLQESPLLGAWVAEALFENGIGSVLVARSLGTNEIVAGIFLVDVWCLGVKSAFMKVFPAESFEEFLADFQQDEVLSEVAPAYAAHLVVESVGYASQLGFSPQRDYGDTTAILAGIDTSRCTDTFVFGREGKPFYVAGPYETPQGSDRIITQLHTVCGKGNYHLLIPVSDKGSVLKDFFAEDELTGRASK